VKRYLPMTEDEMGGSFASVNGNGIHTLFLVVALVETTD